MFILPAKDLAEIYGHPTLYKNREKFKNLFFWSKKSNAFAPDVLFQFQEDILKIITKLEGFIATLKNGSDEEKANIKAYKHLIRVSKWIMDGVALRALKFDPNAYRILSESQNPGNVYDKKGTKNEFRKLKEYADRGDIAILNDLTNFIRLGDITKIDLPRHKIELIECKDNRGKDKTGKNNSNKPTLSTQEIKMKEAEKMVNNFHPVHEKRGEGNINLLPFKAKTFLNKINSGIKRAHRDGDAFFEVDEYIKLHIFYKKDFNVLCDILNKNPHFPLEHEKFLFSNFDTYMAIGGEFFHTVFPFSVIKLPTELIMDLMLGQIFIIVEFSFTNYYKKFESLGFEIIRDKAPIILPIGQMMNKETMPLEKSPMPSITLKKAGTTITLPDTFIARIAYEYILTESFIKNIEYNFENRSSLRGIHNLSLFKNHLNIYQ